MTSRGILFVVCLIAYLVVLTFAGAYFSRLVSKGKNFLSAGKEVGVILLVGTLAATAIGPNSSVGATGNGYLYGWGGAIVGAGLMLGMLGMLPFISTRKYGFLTLAEEIQFFYAGDMRIRRVISIVLFIIEIIWTAAMINGGSRLFCYVTGMDAVYAKTLIAIGFVLLSAFGGYFGVILTDTIQSVIILIGFVIAVFCVYKGAGGFAGVQTAYEAAGNSGALSFLGYESYGGMATITLLVTSFFNIVAVPAQHIRLFTVKSDKKAYTSFGINAFIMLAFAFLPAIIGMCTFAMHYQNGTVMETVDFVFAHVGIDIMPKGIGFIFLIAGLSAVISSGDTDMLSGVTVLIEDVYPSFTGKAVSEKNYRKISRICMLITTGLSLLLSLYANDVIAFTTTVIGAFLPGVGTCILLGRFWKRTTWQGGMVSLIGSMAFALAYLMIPAIQNFIFAVLKGPAIAAVICSMILNVVVSLLTKPDMLTNEEKQRMVLQTREEFQRDSNN